MPTPKEAGGAKSPTNEWAALAKAADSRLEEAGEAKTAANGSDQAADWSQALSEEQTSEAQATAPKPGARAQTAKRSEATKAPPAAKAAERVQQDTGGKQDSSGPRPALFGGRRPRMTRRETRRIDEIEAEVASLTESLRASIAENQASVADLHRTIEASQQATKEQDAELRGEIEIVRDTANREAAELSEAIATAETATRQATEEVRSAIAVLSDETTADVGRQIDALRDTIGERIARIDDKAADILSRLTDEVAALRQRVLAVETVASSAESNLEDLVRRVERGRVDASERIASVADGLEQALGEGVASAQRSATADNVALGKEIEGLRKAVQAAAAGFSAEEDGEDLESGLGVLASKVRGIDSGFSTILERLDSILNERADRPRSAPARLEPDQTVALNSATFEELRALGLSVTQTARLIAFRDTHDGFKDLEQLREVRGLSSEDLRMLAEHTSL